MNNGTQLSIDILCEIFLLLCDQPIALHHLKNKRHLHEFPWAVGQVCKHWRWVFLSYPALWSTLSFNDPALPCSLQPSSGYIAEMNRRATTYLKRSAQRPLTLVVHIPNSMAESFSTTIWGLLLSYSDRWKRADLEIKTSMVNGLVRRIDKMPILESLAIVVYMSFNWKHEITFKNARYLTELTLNGVPATGGSGVIKWEMGKWMFRFPWAQLTKLRIDIDRLCFADRNELETFLLQLRNVEELRIAVFRISFDSDVPGACLSVCFPRLKRLETTFSFSWMLSCFETPLLQYLWVCGSFNNINHRHEYKENLTSLVLTSLVHRSSCHIRRLTLQNCEVEVAYDIMEVLVSVEELYVEEMLCTGIVNVPSLVQDIVDGVLSNLRVLQVPCCAGQFEQVISAASRLFQTRNREPGSEPVVHPLKRLAVTVGRVTCACGSCDFHDIESRVIDKVLEDMCRRPSFSVISLNDNRWNRTLTVRAVVAGTLIDLALCYGHYYSYVYHSERSRRHYRILESKRMPVNS
ncbi:hypothetical protein F5887DRAFT_1244620 [Amanita rubescens]|nr:hypothetical protein F5887DRAFT_1244620 [Amanita rubescens]